MSKCHGKKMCNKWFACVQVGAFFASKSADLFDILCHVSGQKMNLNSLSVQLCGATQYFTQLDMSV